MTGTKPDPRIRTPMQWSAAPAAGFTTGVRWEPLQPDSMLANVAAMEKDSASLLALYRKLIHLRNANPALAKGELIPLTTSNEAVTAFVRREGTRVILCVANLGDAAVAMVRLTSDAVGIGIPAGRYRLRSLLGRGAGEGVLEVERGGRITGAAAWGSIPGKKAWLVEMVR